ncbi:MAG: NAD(P)-dependent oxidoreductase [Rhodospirillales bacterium]|nr:NAD(P)-dependent oxidoreductase [Rhodospirillales bacterium]
MNGGKVYGIAGCGNMGLPMSRQLRRHGFDVWGFDVRPASEFGDFEDRMIADPAAFAARVDILFSIVRDNRQTEDLLFDVQALYACPNPPQTLVISSTLSPRFLATIQHRLPADVLLMDAPMSGTGFRAEDGTLTFMVGGPQDKVAELTPALQAMGREIHYLGPTGAGLTCKVVNNFVAASNIVAVRHALEATEALGVERDTILKVIASSSGDNWYAQNFAAIDWALEGYDKGNTMGIIKKDVASYLDAISGPDGKPASDFENSVHSHMGMMKDLKK